MANRNDIVSAARSYLGVKWRHQGRSRENGIDCAGLTVMVAKDLSLADSEAYNLVDYPRRPDGTFVSHYRKYCVAKSPAKAEDGDILIFNQGAGNTCHVGIRSTYHGRPGLIHSYAGMRKVVEQTLSSAESTIGKPVFCFEFKNIEN